MSSGTSHLSAPLLRTRLMPDTVRAGGGGGAGQMPTAPVELRGRGAAPQARTGRHGAARDGRGAGQRGQGAFRDLPSPHEGLGTPSSISSFGEQTVLSAGLLWGLSAGTSLPVGQRLDTSLLVRTQDGSTRCLSTGQPHTANAQPERPPVAVGKGRPQPVNKRLLAEGRPGAEHRPVAPAGRPGGSPPPRPAPRISLPRRRTDWQLS